MHTTLNRLKEKRGDEGFTLIELLIVIIILAILATIVIFAVGTTTKNASIASCKATVKSVETALEAYKATNGTYPTGTGLAVLSGATKWLRHAPTATVAKNKYHITTTAGKVLVSTHAGTTTAKTADTTTPTPCTAA